MSSIKTQTRLKNSNVIIAAVLLLALAGVSLLELDALPVVYSSLVYSAAYFYRRKSLCDAIVDRLIKVIYLLIMSINMLTIAKITVFRDCPGAVVYVWYCMYIPILLIPYFIFEMGRYATGRETKETMTPLMYVLLSATVILCILMLTNNLHHLVFIPAGAPGDIVSSYRFGPVYYIIGFLIIAEFLAFLITMTRFVRPSIGRKAAVRPFLYIPVFLAFAVLYRLGILKVQFGRVFMTSYDIYVLFVLCILESCISHGLFQVNDGYDEIFSAGLAAAISDRDGNPVLAGEKYYEALNSLSGDIRIKSVRIPGATVAYAEDISAINSAIRELAEINAQLKEENDIAAYENQENRKKAEYETKNRLLDEVALAVNRVAGKIRELVDCEPDAPDVDERLRKACVLMSYVKRRADFTVAQFEGRFLGAYDLYIALSEMKRYMERCSVECTVTIEADSNPGTKRIIPAFETIGKLMMECLTRKERCDVEICVSESGDARASIKSDIVLKSRIDSVTELRPELHGNVLTVHLTETEAEI